MTNKPTGNTNSTHQGLKLQTVPVDMSIRIETPNSVFAPTLPPAKGFF
jgi:hypothetical protein